MSTDVLSSAAASSAQRYTAVLRISKVLPAYRPGEFARILADKLGEWLPFNHLDLVIFNVAAPHRAHGQSLGQTGRASNRCKPPGDIPGPQNRRASTKRLYLHNERFV
jgi:hypothetical protein